jgi:hypothetical protein
VIGVDPAPSTPGADGPVTVEGLDEPLTAENAVHILTKRQYLDFSKDEDSRKELLEDATRETFKKLTKASLPAPRKLGDVLGPAVRGRHIQVWSPTAREQALFERVHADGAIAIAEGSDGSSGTWQQQIDAYLSAAPTTSPSMPSPAAEENSRSCSTTRSPTSRSRPMSSRTVRQHAQRTICSPRSW